MAGYSTVYSEEEETKICRACGIRYSRGGQSKVAFATSKYCSRACYLKVGWKGTLNPRYKERKIVHCFGCGNVIVPKSRAMNRVDRTDKRKFCSNHCRKGPLHSNWKGGKFKIDKGYIKVSMDNGTSQYEHILIAQKALGRKLRKGEVVHHIDGVKDNNANSNLFICTNEYHRWLHEEMSRLYALEKFGQRIDTCLLGNTG